MHFADRTRLLDPAPMPLELGWKRLANGVLHVAIRTDMHRCTGEMFEWWFASRIGDREYRWWHPHDHISSSWIEGTPGTIPGSIHQVEERFTGSPPEKLDPIFVFTLPRLPKLLSREPFVLYLTNPAPLV